MCPPRPAPDRTAWEASLESDHRVEDTPTWPSSGNDLICRFPSRLVLVIYSFVVLIAFLLLVVVVVVVGGDVVVVGGGGDGGGGVVVVVVVVVVRWCSCV